MSNWKRFLGVLLLLLLVIVLVAYSQDSGSEATNEKEEMGELVPELSLMTSLPEENQISYEAAGDMSDVIYD